MKTLIPTAIDLLKSFAQQTVRGLRSLGATLGITYNTEAKLSADLNAMMTANAECQAAKAVLAKAQQTLEGASEAAAGFLMVARDLLKPQFGNRYSVNWDQVGFFNRTLEIPRSVAKRLGLLKSMELYFKAHPELELAGVATQAMAAALYETLASSVDLVAIARVDKRDKRTARDAAALAVSKRLRALRRELKETLGNNDSRWLEFGFNIPATIATPEAPTAFTVVPGGVGSAVLSWVHSVGATRYRVYIQTMGVDADFVYLDTLADLSKTVTGLASGTHMRFYVTAANDAGESLRSEIVEVAVP